MYHEPWRELAVKAVVSSIDYGRSSNSGCRVLQIVWSLIMLGIGYLLTSAKINLCRRICLFILATVIAAMIRRLPTINPWPHASRTRPSGSVGRSTRSLMMNQFMAGTKRKCRRGFGRLTLEFVRRVNERNMKSVDCGNEPPWFSWALHAAQYFKV